MKRRIVTALESGCEYTHWLVLRRPWLWIFRQCPLGRLSAWLDQRWSTGVWDTNGGPS